MKAYGFKCRKCSRLVADTRAPFLVYAKNVDGAERLLQDAVKGHDIVAHGDDDRFPSFQIVVFYPRER